MRRLGSLTAVVAVLAVAAVGVAGWQGLRMLQQTRAALAGLEPGPIDVGFAQSMSLHHQQAIGMAQIMMDERSAGLPRAIAYAQLEELGQMRGWLRLWGKPLLPETRSMDWMLLGDTPLDAELTRYLLDCQRSPTGMTGLATDAELNRLRQLQGRERDRLFLQMMLAHHEGGVPMARFAAQQAQLPAVRELAARVVLDQSVEIDQIQQRLALLAATDAPAEAPAGPAVAN